MSENPYHPRPDGQDLKAALETLRSGGVILYPTDTIWGLGCDALNVEALARINRIKGRAADKNAIILLENENQLQSYVEEVPEVAYQLIEYTERPLTIIYSGAKNLPPELIAEDGSIGIRIVKHPFTSPLLQRFRRPIVSTSANFSGQSAPAHFHDIDPEIIEAVDYTVQYGQEEAAGDAQPSMIMKLEPGGKFSFLRK